MNGDGPNISVTVQVRNVAGPIFEHEWRARPTLIYAIDFTYYDTGRTYATLFGHYVKKDGAPSVNRAVMSIHNMNTAPEWIKDLARTHTPPRWVHGQEWATDLDVEP